MKLHAIDIHINLSCAACGEPVRTVNNGSMDGPDSCEGFELGFEPCSCNESAIKDVQAAIRMLKRRGITLEHIEQIWQQYEAERAGMLPEGVTLVPLGDPSAMHAMIADAVGEVQS